MRTADGTTSAPPGARFLRDPDLRLKSALFDPVTGLPAYNLHLERLELQSAGRRIGVLIVEFPDFGVLEQAHGWEAGDRFLAGVARHLRSLIGGTLPAGTLIGLEGVYGHTFVLFVAEAEGRADVTAADLAQASAGLALDLEPLLARAAWAPGPPRADFSVGYALVSRNPSARFERRVHQAIREARSMTLREADWAQRQRGAELRTVLQEGRLTTHYQPIVDMDVDRIVGYEALTRGPENSPLEVPKALFLASEANRLAGDLDALCRQEAVRNARGFDKDKKLFLNSLPETLGSPGRIERDLAAVLDEADLAPHNVVLEITERTAIEDFESFGRELDRLHRQGYLIAIDDVGTGYSSLQTISEVAADFLKIDMSLIKNIHQSLIKQDLVRSLLQVAARTRARVIAEGIETAEEYRALRACGVRYGQGFWFAAPAPPFPGLARGARDGA